MDHYMLHFSPCRNRSSILKHGLKPRRGSGKLRAVWLVAVMDAHIWRSHIASHQSCEVEELDVWAVNARSLVLQNRGRGRYTCTSAIAPERLQLIVESTILPV
jgi:hypothetical protein